MYSEPCAHSTQDETDWHDTWGGQVATVATGEEAVIDLVRLNTYSTMRQTDPTGTGTDARR